MFEFTIANDKYNVKQGQYLSFIVEKNNEFLFNLYPYRRVKDQFILTIFKNFIKIDDNFEQMIYKDEKQILNKPTSIPIKVDEQVIEKNNNDNKQIQDKNIVKKNISHVYKKF